MTTLPPNEVNDAQPSTGYTPMPDGDYTLEIVESDYVANAKGNGMVAKLQCQVIGGEYDGRPYYINLNLEHQNEVAQKIAQRDFLALRTAVGVSQPRRTEELHGIPFRVEIGVATNDDTGAPVNVIEAYHPADGGRGGQGGRPCAVCAAWGGPAQDRTPRAGGAPLESIA